MTSPCCPIGKHPRAADIDRLIRAQQAASQSGQSTLAMSYSQIARTYDIRKATLLAHRDVCLAQRTGTVDDAAPVRSDGVPGRTAGGADDENTSDFARSDRYGASVPASGAESADPGRGRATGPPGAGTDRRSAVPGAAHGVPTRAAQHDADVVDTRGAGSAGAVQPGAGVGAGTATASAAVVPPRPPGTDRARARAREQGRLTWDKMAHEAVEQAAQNLANATHDIAIRDPSVRAHASYVEEVAEIVQAGEWEDERTVQRLTRAWQKSRLFVLQCHRDACTLIRIARGTRFEQIESSAARWMNLYKIAIQSEEGVRVAAEALKGHDRVLGLVDSGTKVQINIAQSDEAKLFVSIFLDEAKGDPALLERIRRRLAEARDKLGDPTALLTTGAEVDAAE